MRIGIITPSYPPKIHGGGEISVQLLAEQIRQQTEHQVTVHSFDGSARESVNGVPVIRHRKLPMIPEIASTPAAVELYSEVSSYDIIHGYNMILHPAIGLLSAQTETPSVAHLNSYTFLNKRKLDMPLSRKEQIYNDIIRPVTSPAVHRLISKIDTLIALSPSVEEIYRNSLKYDTNIEVIPNMVDLDSTPETVDYCLTDQPNLLYVGQLEKRKGVEYLVKSLKHLEKKVDLTVVGTGSDLSRLKSIASEFDTALVSIQFTGQIPHDEVWEQYAKSDIFVHPGIWPEPLNRTIFEAMQHGLAVVSTDQGGPADIINDDRLLASPRDSMELARSINYAIENLERLGKENYEYVHDTFHPNSVVNAITSVYEGLHSE